jgi:hypothetical protein
MWMRKVLPYGNVNGKKIIRVNGDGDWEAFLIPVPRGDPLNLHRMMFSCNI